jgi:putative ABC transport system permease protein
MTTAVVLALRGLWRRPAAVLGAILVLIAGSGLAATTFALADPFLSKPLPYYRPNQLVLIDLDLAGIVENSRQVQFPSLLDWQARRDLFTGLAAFAARPPLRVAIGERFVELQAVTISPNLFQVLEGRTEPASISDHALWLTHAGALGLPRHVSAGDLLRQADGAMVLRGVLPESFVFPQPDQTEPAEALVLTVPGPIATIERTPGLVRTSQLTMVGRLADHASAGAVEAALNVAAGGRFRVRVRLLTDAMKQRHRTLAMGALVSALLVLLVSVAGTAGFGLTRGLYRALQIGTMQALGADYRTIAGILLAESGIVAMAATAGALALTPWLLRLVRVVMPQDALLLGAPTFDLRVVLAVLAAGVCGGTAWGIGSFAAWRRRLPPGFVRTDGSRDARLVRTLRFAAIAAQVMFTFLILASAVLLGRSYLRLVNEDTGMSDRTMALSVSYPAVLHDDLLRQTIAQTIVDLKQMPGVHAAAAAVGQMVDDSNLLAVLVVNGRPTPVDVVRVSDDYFDVVGMSFIEGGVRTLSGHPGSIVVNQSLASRLLGPNVPIGTPIRVLGVAPLAGIVRDARRQALDRPPRPTAFLPLDALPAGARVTYLLATDGTGAISIDEWTRDVYSHAKDAAILDASSLRERLMRSVQDRAFAALIVSLFGSATAVITLTGLVGVVGYVVARRTREIGIRLAIGAPARHVVWLVMRDVVRASGAGIAAGLIANFWISALSMRYVDGIIENTWRTPIVVGLTVLAAASIAAAVPAIKARAIQPTIALRNE